MVPNRKFQPNKNLKKFEETIRQEGYSVIAGVDEVGRGCLAGPVVAAAVILDGEKEWPGVDDSKKLSPEKREAVYSFIIQNALAFGVGQVEAPDIDRMNILRASLKAMRLAVESLHLRPDLVLVDGNQPIPLLTVPQRPLPKADALSVSVAAASIIAKVTRDRLMKNFVQEFGDFRFDLHKGYGTPQHLSELRCFGPTRIHRRSFGIALRG